jgi:hypothetical protein
MTWMMKLVCEVYEAMGKLWLSWLARPGTSSWRIQAGLRHFHPRHRVHRAYSIVFSLIFVALGGGLALQVSIPHFKWSTELTLDHLRVGSGRPRCWAVASGGASKGGHSQRACRRWCSACFFGVYQAALCYHLIHGIGGMPWVLQYLILSMSLF